MSSRQWTALQIVLFALSVSLLLSAVEWGFP